MSTTPSQTVRVLYTAEATATGGRKGHGRTSDGRLDVDFSSPTEMGGDGGPGTNPEQLFATGFAACFQNAIMSVARCRNLAVDDSIVRGLTSRTCAAGQSALMAGFNAGALTFARDELTSPRRLLMRNAGSTALAWLAAWR